MSKKKKSKLYYFVVNYAYNEKITVDEAFKSVDCKNLYNKIFKESIFRKAGGKEGVVKNEHDFFTQI